MRALIVGEPTSTMQVGLDTGVILAQEMLSRGWFVDYINIDTVDWDQPHTAYFSSLPFQKLVKVFQGQAEPFVLEKPNQQDVHQYDVIWQRLDPPVNQRYIGHMNHFSHLPDHILQINHPSATWRFSEHLLPQKFPEFSVPTWECGTLEQFLDLVKNSSGEVVAKPLHLYSGLGIEFFSSRTPESELLTYWEKWKPKVAIQPFLNEITTLGDLRIIVMNQRVIGSVLRKPKTGSRLANLHQGGSAHFFSPTAKQLEACKVVSRDLNAYGLYLLGLDFIGDYLTEVNITCPSAVPQINRVMGIQGEKRIIDEMVSLHRLRPERISIT
jgi:glutathione synthase